jgi:hypothetical protein
MATDDTTARRRALLDQIRDLTTAVALAVRAARRLGLPVEPGVAEGGLALGRWVNLLEELLP